MGRKPRVSKPENFQPTSAPNSLPEVQTTTTEGTCLSDTSRVVKKKLKTPTAIIRRSPRTQNTSGNQSIEPVIDHRIVNGSQNNTTWPVVHEGIEHKEASEVIITESRSSKKDDIGAEDIKYKAMYRSSQKKIEALFEENRQLSNALELAKGKIEVHEKQSNAYSEVMDVIQSLSKVNEHLAARVYPGTPSDDNKMFEERSAKKKKNVTFDITNKL